MSGNPNNRFIINERREKVFIMLSQGLNETEIAKELNVGQPTICRDLKSIKKESQKKIESIIDDVLPYEYRKCILSTERIIKECWKIILASSRRNFRMLFITNMRQRIFNKISKTIVIKSKPREELTENMRYRRD